jgi:hypothetical protein
LNPADIEKAGNKRPDLIFNTAFVTDGNGSALEVGVDYTPSQLQFGDGFTLDDLALVAESRLHSLIYNQTIQDFLVRLHVLPRDDESHYGYYKSYSNENMVTSTSLRVPGITGVAVQGLPIDVRTPNIQFIEHKFLKTPIGVFILLTASLEGVLLKEDIIYAISDHFGCPAMYYSPIPIDNKNTAAIKTINLIVTLSTPCTTTSGDLLDFDQFLGDGVLLVNGGTAAVPVSSANCLQSHKLNAKCHTGVNMPHCNLTSGQDILLRSDGEFIQKVVAGTVESAVLLPIPREVCIQPSACSGQHFYDNSGAIVCGADCCIHSFDSGHSIVKLPVGKQISSASTSRRVLTEYTTSLRNIPLKSAVSSCDTSFSGMFDCWADEAPTSYVVFVVMGALAAFFFIGYIIIIVAKKLYTIDYTNFRTRGKNNYKRVKSFTKTKRF